MTDRTSIQIVPTWVPRQIEDLQGAVASAKEFAGALHLDINDGLFACPFSWPYEGQGRLGDLTRGLDRAIDKTVDNFLMQIHLMVSDSREIGEFFITHGAHTIVTHVESYGGDTDATHVSIDAWRARGVREVGLAILLDTPIGNLDSLLPYCDYVHVMSVATIGAQGALFDPRAIDRIHDLHTRLPDLPIAVDGGVSLSTIASLLKAGATRFSVGSAIMKADVPAEAYAQLKSAAESAVQ